MYASTSAIKITIFFADPFSIHFEKDIPDETADKLGETSAWTTQQLHVNLFCWSSDFFWFLHFTFLCALFRFHILEGALQFFPRIMNKISIHQQKKT